MIILLSPAKAMNETSGLVPQSTPVFLDKSRQLVEELRQLAAEDVSRLMKLSPELAQLNAKRFQNWRPIKLQNNTTNPKTKEASQKTGKKNRLVSKESKHSKRAGFAAAGLFDGPAFRGLSFSSLDSSSQKHGQKSLRILSGLYGILRPLDLILPYRLEMGTSFAPLQKDGLLKNFPKNLYDFWGMDITDFLRNELEQNKAKKQAKPLLVNLASREYSKAACLHGLDANVLSPVFLDRTKSGQYKTLMAYAKRARGLMARFLIERRAQGVDDLLKFDLEGYRYDPARSEENSPVFVRDPA